MAEPVTANLDVTEGVIRASIQHCAAPNHCIVVIPESGFFFTGYFRFQCLYGHVTVNGYIVKDAPYRQDNFLEVGVHSLANVPMLIKPVKLYQPFDTNILTDRLKDLMETVTPKLVKAATAFGQNFSVLLLSTSTDDKISYINERLGNAFKPLDRYKKLRVGGNCFIVYGILTDTIEKLSLTETFDLVQLEKMFCHLKRAEKNSKKSIVVLGPKDAGKSSLTRYLMNYFLGEGKKVYLLDTDIGQSEFTPCGCVSLTRMTDPIFSLPFMHQQRDFDACLYVGTITPVSDLPLYKKSVQALIRHYQSCAEPDSYLFVNTMGWIEGLGREISLDIINSLNPSVLINIPHPMGIMDLNDNRVPRSAKLFTYDPPPRCNYNTSNKVSAKSWREFTITGYLANCLADDRLGKPDIGRTLASVACRACSFKRLSILIHPTRGFVTDNLILNALNHQVIALCTFFGDEDRKNAKIRRAFNDPSFPGIVQINRRNPPALKCLAFGLVRSVSTDDKTIYIITPASREVCESVEILALGNGIHTPHIIFERDDCNAVPYIIQPVEPDVYRHTVHERTSLINSLYDPFERNTVARAIRRNQ